MKKIFILLTLTLLLGSLFADLMQPTEAKTALTDAKGRTKIRTTRDAPTYEFVVNPADLITNFYDYMPGSYNGLPVRIQPETSQPFGHPAGGVYMTYHIRETASTNRRQYYTYIDNEGHIQPPAPIGVSDIWEGYGGIDIDPFTGDPMVSWHQQAGATYDDMFSYDLYHILGGPGLWKEPFIVIDNYVMEMNPEDEFIWPYVNIGPSPLGEEYRRVYVNGNNAASNTPGGNPSENMYIAYADFSSADLDAQSELDWTYQSIPLMDEWHNQEPWTRPFHAFCVSQDGKVAIMGYTVSDGDDYDDKLFVFLNDNYGDADSWTYYNEGFGLGETDVVNPLNQAGTEATFLNDNGNPYNLYFGFTNSGHQNAIFTDDGMKIRFNGAAGLNGDDPDGGDGVYWPYAIYPKVVEFDIASENFVFQNLDTIIDENSSNPDYVWPEDVMYLPWDTDNDGLIDEYDTDGSVLWYSGWPCHFYDNDTAFHENGFKIVQNAEQGWLAAVWQDGLRAKYANDGVEGYEDWAGVPEIAIAVSKDNGHTWSDALFLNSIDTPELVRPDETAMIPVYIYPGDKLEYVDGNTFKMHLMFLDDYSYGSSVHNFGIANGGMMKYAALNIEFPSEDPSNANDILSFSIPEQTGETEIDQVAHTVQLYVPVGTDVTDLTPTIEVSYMATIDPESGTPQDFTGPVEYTVTAENGDMQDWTVTVSFAISAEDDLILSETKLLGNYPNPFTASTDISFNLKHTDHTSLDIYNTLGQKVKTLVNNDVESGVHNITWDGTDNNNQRVASGIYYYKLSQNNETTTRKMILMR